MTRAATGCWGRDCSQQAKPSKSDLLRWRTPLAGKPRYWPAPAAACWPPLLLPLLFLNLHLHFHLHLLRQLRHTRRRLLPTRRCRLLPTRRRLHHTRRHLLPSRRRCLRQLQLQSLPQKGVARAEALVERPILRLAGPAAAVRPSAAAKRERWAKGQKEPSTLTQISFWGPPALGIGNIEDSSAGRACQEEGECLLGIQGAGAAAARRPRALPRMRARHLV